MHDGPSGQGDKPLAPFSPPNAYRTYNVHLLLVCTTATIVPGPSRSHTALIYVQYCGHETKLVASGELPNPA
jgi:hypothetical protein